VHLPSLTIVAVLLIGAGLAGWLALRFWQDRAPTSKPVDPDINVRAELQVSRTHGWTFFNLVLVNRSRMRIAVVDATFTISGLVAKFQASPVTKETTFKIRRILTPGGLLGSGLVEQFYNAAGKPQGGYSFEVATTVRYRAHGDLFEQALPLYRVTMFALSPNSLQRIRWYNKPAATAPIAQHLPELDPADLRWLEAEAGPAASV
jgi:hypothetical protein